MNLRQKAKRFKRLYECSLPRKSPPISLQEQTLKHYRAAHLVPKSDLSKNEIQALLHNQVVASLLYELRPLVENNLIVEKDYYPGMIKVSVDVWARNGEKCDS